MLRTNGRGGPASWERRFALGDDDGEPRAFFCISATAHGESKESFDWRWAPTAESGGSPITSTVRGFSRPDRSSFGTLFRDGETSDGGEEPGADGRALRQEGM